MLRIMQVGLVCIVWIALSSPLAYAEQFFIRFHDGTDKQANERWLENNGIRVVKRFQIIEALFCEMKDKSAAPLAALKTDSRVQYAEPNGISYLAASPNDPIFNLQWSLHNTGQEDGTAGADVSWVEARNLVSGAQEVLVAIIDTGVDYTHPDLVNRMWDGGAQYPNHGYDFAHEDDDPMPTNYHGTHIAGTVAAEIDNALGVAGLAANARIMALKVSLDTDSVFDGFEDYYLISAMDFCFIHGVDVINASYGGFRPSAPEIFLEAMWNLHDAGVVFVAGAGNDVTNLDEHGSLFYPACLDVPNVISVASTDRNDQLSVFSNYGMEHIDLAAPGTDIMSTSPNNAYQYASGTSMATPHVTGAAAILRGLYPDLTPAEVRSIIMNGSKPLPSLSRKVITGGRLDLISMLAAADMIPPGQVLDLAVTAAYANSLRLRWTAVGDDGYSGTAFRNDLRYSLAPILDEDDFSEAFLVQDYSPPQAAGQLEALTVTGLDPQTTYYFALRVGDRGGNWSPLAFASGTTSATGVASLDETPLIYSAFTGQKTFSVLSLQNMGSGSLEFLVRAVSIGQKQAALSRIAPITSPQPDEEQLPTRSSGSTKRGPKGASGFYALYTESAEKSNDWGTLFHDDLEIDDGFWNAETIEGEDLWHYSTSAYNSPGHSLAFADPMTGNYDTGFAHDVAMTSGPINLINAEGNITLEFFEWYNTELGHDFCNVEVSGDAGLSWDSLRSGTSGESEGWRLTTIDLSAYAGQQVQIRFRFTTEDVLFNDYPGWYIDDVTIRDGGTSWLAVFNGVGHVLAHSTRDIIFQVNAQTLCAGEYQAEIQVFTNDSAHSQFIVPVTLTVESAADLHFQSMGLDMGTAFVGYPTSRVFAISNIGCETLTIAGLSSSSAEFETSISETAIPPGEVAELQVIYTPTAATNGIGMITFNTNDPDAAAVTLVAYGSGVLGPEILVPDVTYMAEIHGETTWCRPLEIRNDGQGELHWQFAKRLNTDGDPATQKRVLFDFAPGFFKRSVLQTQLSAAGYELAFLEELDSITQDMLDNADVLILYGYSPLVELELTLIADWVAAGGGLFLDWRNATELNQILDSIGLGATMLPKARGTTLMTPLVDHALSEGVGEVYGNHSAILEGVNTPLVPFLTSPIGDLVQAFGTIGKGRLFLSTMLFTLNGNLVNADNEKLADNVIAWLANGALTMVPDAGILAPGASHMVDVVFDSNDLFEGTYDYPFYITSNDPAVPIVSIQATYQLTGIGHILLAQNSYDMGLVYAAADTTQFIELVNTGNRRVFIQGINSSNDRFQIRQPNMLLMPKERKNLEIILRAGDIGPEATEIVIVSDAPGQEDLRFSLNANPQLPVAVVDPENLGEVTLYTGGSDQRILTISNAGLWPLEFNIEGEEPPFIGLASSPNQTLAPGESSEVIIEYNAIIQCDVDGATAIFTILDNNPAPAIEVSASLAVIHAQHIVPCFDNYMACPVGLPRPGISQIISIKNEGCADLDVISISLEADDCFMLTEHFTGIIQPDSQRDIARLYFWPEEVEVFYATLVVASDDPDQNEIHLDIRGEGLPVSPNEFDGEEPAPVSKILTNAPNPFNPFTTISFYMPHAGNATVRIHNMRGQLVRTLAAGALPIGRGSVEWNGMDQQGRAVASGVYFYQLYIDGRRNGATSRATLTK